jgi:hypothetical protein
MAEVKVWKAGDVAILKRRRGIFPKQCKVEVVFPGTYDFKTGKCVEANWEIMVRVIDLMGNESPEMSGYIKGYDKQVMEDFLNGKITFEEAKNSDALRSVIVLLPDEIKE